MSIKYDGWVAQYKGGRLLVWSFALTRKGVIHKKIGHQLWQAWKRTGYRIVKVRLVEVVK